MKNDPKQLEFEFKSSSQPLSYKVLRGCDPYGYPLYAYFLFKDSAISYCKHYDIDISNIIPLN